MGRADAIAAITVYTARPATARRCLAGMISHDSAGVRVLLPILRASDRVRTAMNHNHAGLSSYLRKQLSEGHIVFTASQARAALGIGAGALIEAAQRQRERLISPRRGFYVIVPPRFRDEGAPPPDWYIHELMAHLNRPYYVGLFTAAQLHVESRRPPVPFQVITDRPRGPIRAGPYRIVFRYRKHMEGVARGVERHDTDTGHMNVSGAELTALDLVRYPGGDAGVDRISAALSDLARQLDPVMLAALSATFERSVAQRLGHLLDRLGCGEQTAALHDALTRGGQMYWVEFDPLQGADRYYASAVTERDERWRVKVRRPS